MNIDLIQRLADLQRDVRATTKTFLTGEVFVDERLYHSMLCEQQGRWSMQCVHTHYPQREGVTIMGRIAVRPRSEERHALLSTTPNAFTRDELDDLRDFVREYRDGMNAIGDAPIPTPAALRAMDKLLKSLAWE